MSGLRVRSLVVLLLGVAGVWAALPGARPTPASAATSASAPARACTVAGSRVVPRSGAWFGVSLDWSRQSLAAYGRRLGRRPAVAVSFVPLPMRAAEGRNLDLAAEQVRGTGGILLVTLEPQGGLGRVTRAVARSVARRMAGYNRRGVPVVVRFAHEMNGSWYPWAQQPRAYVAAFRRVSAAVRRTAPATAMLWAPNYGGGYPFAGGRYQAAAGGADARALDTNGDGTVTGTDDPYAPYYPGDRYVDWVGMTLYHFGNVHPWGENEVPEPGKFAALLTGTYAGLNGDETAVPDFYAEFGVRRRKPVAIPETGALYAPGRGGAAERAVKSAWWNQAFAAETRSRFPRIRMINWFEWDKQEAEIGGRVDWTVTRSATTRSAFRSALPSWLRFAGDVRGCGR